MDLQERIDELADRVSHSTFVLAALMWSAFACGVASGATAMTLLYQAVLGY
jgi:hypothetical protein